MTTTATPTAAGKKLDGETVATIGWILLGVPVLAGAIGLILVQAAHDSHQEAQVLSSVHARYGAAVINTDELNYGPGRTVDNLVVRLPGGRLTRCEAAIGTASPSDVTLLCGTNRVEPPRR